jgi:hypothetical protein
LSNWANGKNVVVLGAGATRGAEFVGKEGGPACIPPLNADFFTQLQRVSSPNLQVDIDGVINDVVDLFGINFSLTLEDYFSLLQGLLDGRESFLLGKGPKYSATWLRQARSRLMNALSAVLEESADVSRAKGYAVVNQCSYHDRIVDALHAPDTIISFNYDCVIDHALRKNVRGAWSARFGYGFRNAGRVEPDSAAIWSGPNPPERQNETIRLLKLHGSLNWRPLPETNEDPIGFRQKLYKQNGQKNFHIIPPEYVKTLDQENLRSLWTKAASALKSAQSLALVGFSFPRTDQLVDSMFRISLAENTSLSKIIIVNPSQMDRARIRQICAPALSRKVRLVQFDTLAEFAPHAASLLRN